ncbi:ANTAR domain-containing protein [Paenarthrobacter sp. AT5]|uniref:GAF and ANTAR domain-containing protein n=1 Tax=Paenarthrobacter TaxID=1742992 RepID=UPI001A9992B1|nr:MULTISPECIES: GAF and ANTAR domain-containing protein [Paenarthrobacter]QSZ52092.1 response regulator receiver protein [Paenarthrobacter ureafaciens]WOC61173.1 ANTAR domain-containing protein [Paenarthrobacter sp. AT5]
MEDQQQAAPHLVAGEIQDLFLDNPDVEAFLTELTRHSAAMFSTADADVFCGVTLLRHRTAATVASSGERALLLDELQYQFAEGPCLLSARKGVQVHVPDLAADDTWPDYKEVALAQGIRSILALPIPLPDDSAKASMNLYSERTAGFDQATVQRATDYVQQAAKGLSLAVMIAQHSQTAANLRAAMASRTVIDVATGIIIAQNRCTQAEAVELIKRASSNRNVKLREVAEAIVKAAGGGNVETHFK